jgi:hypothetical protein
MHIRGVDRSARLLGTVLGDEGETYFMRRDLGYWPNLRTPHTFNEKLARRRKLCAPRPVWSRLADKWAVREFVADRVGPSFLNEAYLATTEPNDIVLDRLPGSFVVKATHGSGWNLLVPDAASASVDEIRRACADWLGRRYGANTTERWYDAIPPRIVVERYLRDGTHGVPLDFKAWCFHGVPTFVQVDHDRFGHHTRSFYDPEWRRQPWGTHYPAGPDVPRPALLEELLDVARRLAEGMDFVRVDLYCPDDRAVVFGEMTIAPDGGREPFVPARYDRIVGDLW